MSARYVEFGLTSQQGYLMRILDPGRPAPMNEMASVFGCDASNITGIVDRLETRGFVKREQHPQDRRLKMIALTKAGAEFQVKFLSRIYEPSGAMSALTSAQLQEMRELLTDIEDSRREPNSQSAA